MHNYMCKGQNNCRNKLKIHVLSLIKSQQPTDVKIAVVVSTYIICDNYSSMHGILSFSRQTVKCWNGDFIFNPSAIILYKVQGSQLGYIWECFGNNKTVMLGM